MRPGAHGWFTQEGRGLVSINAAGQRDIPHSIEKPAGVFRVAVLGDSYAEAMQVNVAETFWWQLRDRLTQCGYGRGQAWDRWRIVQLAHAARTSLSFSRPIRRASVTASVQGVEAGIDPAVFVPPRDSVWERASWMTERLIAKAREATARNSERLVLVLGTHSLQIAPADSIRLKLKNALGVPNLFYVEELQRLGRREGIEVYEMQRRARAEGTHCHGFRNVGLDVGHWNQAGHRVAAELIASGSASMRREGEARGGTQRRRAARSWR